MKYVMIMCNIVIGKTKFEFESTFTYENQIRILEEIYRVEGFQC